MPESKRNLRTALSGWLFRFGVGAKGREYFIENLSMMLAAGVPIGGALESLEEGMSSSRLRQAIRSMKLHIDDGTALWKALADSGIVTDHTIHLVKLGEESGRLTENLRVAATQEEKQRAFRSKLRSAMMYPLFVIGLTALIGVGITWFILPRLADTFNELHVKMPLITRIFIGAGTFLKQHGAVAVPLGMVILGAIFYVLFFLPATNRLGRRSLLYIPGVSGLIKEVEIARFGFLLGSLLDAGLSVVQAFESLAAATDMPSYRLLYQHLQASFEDGFSFKDGFASYKPARKLIPLPLQQMVAAGERSGKLPETLQKIGRLYEDKADTSTKNLATILEPILLVLVWLGVMAVAIAVILPIYSLIGGLQQ